MSKPLAIVLGGAACVLGAALAAWWAAERERTVPGVLLVVGPAAKVDPYAVAQGAVTHGEAVLIDFGDGDFAFLVNRPDEVRALVNGCGERVAPVWHQRFPLLVDARFRSRTAPPYYVEMGSVRYRFDAPTSPTSQGCR